MSSLYTPSHVDPNTVLQVTMPTDGDQRSAQSVRTPLEANTDFIFWLREHGIFNSGTSTGTINHNGTLLVDQIVLPNSGSPTININGNTGFISVTTGFSVETGAHYYFSAARTFTKPCRANGKYTSPNWSASDPVDATEKYTQGAHADPPLDDEWIEFDPDLPNGCTVTALRWFIKPAGSHVAVPSLPPRIQLVFQDITQMLVGLLPAAQGVNTYANVAAYEVAGGHEVVVSGLSVLIDGSYQWKIRVRGEHGTSALNGLQALVPRVTFTMPYVPEGG